MTQAAIGDARTVIRFAHAASSDYATPRLRQYDVEVSVAVPHDNRYIKFSELRDAARRAFERDDFGPLTCEMLAHKLALTLAAEYGREITASVFASDDCGAIATATPRSPCMLDDELADERAPARTRRVEAVPA